jgi:subtilase family serine protease
MRRHTLMMSVGLLLVVALMGCEYAPVPDFPTPTGFCRLQGSNLVVRVENKGPAPALIPSTTRVDFPGFTTQDVTTPPIAAGASVDLMVPIPFGCFNPDCDFRIIVDVNNEIPETDETNNSVADFCLG